MLTEYSIRYHFSELHNFFNHCVIQEDKKFIKYSVRIRRAKNRQTQSELSREKERKCICMAGDVWKSSYMYVLVLRPNRQRREQPLSHWTISSLRSHQFYPWYDFLATWCSASLHFNSTTATGWKFTRNVEWKRSLYTLESLLPTFDFSRLSLLERPKTKCLQGCLPSFHRTAWKNHLCY